MKNKFLSVFHTRMYVSSCKSVDVRIDIVKNEQVKARGWTSARFSETPLQTFFDNIILSFSSSRYF